MFYIDLLRLIHLLDLFVVGGGGAATTAATAVAAVTVVVAVSLVLDALWAI